MIFDMAEPLLRIVARFPINEEAGSPLDGRAYLSAYNFEQAYGSNLVYAFKTLREVVRSPELNPARAGEFKHTIALMWGFKDPDNPRPPYHQMIDFLGWNFNEWSDNAEIFGWQTKDGDMFQPKFGIYPVTCEGGEDILHAEKEHRRLVGPQLFREMGPNVSAYGLKDELDFCNPIAIGNPRLKQLMEQGRYIIPQ
jgi:hypothetical protein